MKYYKLSHSYHNALSHSQMGGGYCDEPGIFKIENIIQYGIAQNGNYYIKFKALGWCEFPFRDQKKLGAGSFGKVMLLLLRFDQNKPPYQIAVKIYNDRVPSNEIQYEKKMSEEMLKNGDLNSYFPQAIMIEGIQLKSYVNENKQLMLIEGVALPNPILIMEYFKANLCGFFREHMNAKLIEKTDLRPLRCFVKICQMVFDAMYKLYSSDMIYFDTKCENLVVCYKDDAPYNATIYFIDFGSIYPNIVLEDYVNTYCLFDYYEFKQNNVNNRIPEHIHLGFACIILIDLLLGINNTPRLITHLSYYNNCGLEHPSKQNEIFTMCSNTFLGLFDGYGINDSDKPNISLVEQIFSKKHEPLNYTVIISEFGRLHSVLHNIISRPMSS